MLELGKYLLAQDFSNNLIHSHFDMMQLEAASLGGHDQKNYCLVPTPFSLPL